MDVFIDVKFARYYEQFPLTLVDIGARGGLQSNWEAARKYLRTVGFEPDPDEFERLANSGNVDKSIKYLKAALYKKEEKVDFHITRSEGASSLFKPNRQFLDSFPESERFDVLRTIEMKADTLDNQLLENNIRDVDFVKVDTQGSELFVLQGAEDLLGRSVFGLEIEVEFTPIYTGQPLFSDIDKFARERGFMLFDLNAHYWKRSRGKRLGGPKGQMIFADALYLKNIHGLKCMLDGIEAGPARQAKVLKALSVCVLYGYFDYALEIFEENQALFAAAEAKTLLSKLEKAIMLATKIPDFAGKGRIANLFYSVYRLLYPTHDGWATGEKAIGNNK